MSARTEGGKFKSDDPSTPLVNESKKNQLRRRRLNEFSKHLKANGTVHAARYCA